MSPAFLQSKTFHTILGFAVSTVLVVWIVLSANWGEVWQAMHGLDYLYLPLLIGLWVVHFSLRALRWNYLLPGEPVKIRPLFDAIMVGNFASFVLPLRAGEFIRPYMLSRETQFTFSTGFMSVVVERFFDLSAVLLTFACIVLIIPQIPEVVYLGAWALGGLAVSIFVFMAIGSFFPAVVLKVVRFCCSFFPDGPGRFVEKLCIDLLEGASVLKSATRLFMVTLYTAVVWFTAYATFYVTLLLFRLPPSWEVAVTVAVVTALAVAMPSAPGFVGVYQSACKLTFPLFGLSPDVAVAFSLVSHALQYLLFIGYGLYVLRNRGMSFGDMRILRAPTSV